MKNFKNFIVLMTLLGWGQTKAQEIVNFAGVFTSSGYYGGPDSGDGGPATHAMLHRPVEIVLIDSVGNYYFNTEESLHKIDSSGSISTISVTGGTTFYELGHMAFDKKRNAIYLPEEQLQRVLKVNLITNFGLTIAGTGIAGYTGDAGPANNARIYVPTSVALDTIGNIYFSDGLNCRIRKIDTNGIITTFAGIGCDTVTTVHLGDGGPATAAIVRFPLYVAFDKQSNMYVACDYLIRKIDSHGIITTVAGLDTNGYSGDGEQATLAHISWPNGIAFDDMGDLYFTDGANYRVRKIDTSGIITTIAGTGVDGHGGDDGPVIAAEFSGTAGLAFDHEKNLLICDWYNDVIRKIEYAKLLLPEIPQPEALKIYPNPFTEKITVEGLEYGEPIVVYDMLGRMAYSAASRAKKETFSIFGLVPGVYTIRAGSQAKKIVKY